MRMSLPAALAAATVLVCSAGEPEPQAYRVLPAIVERNLTVFPVTASRTFFTTHFLTLDEGLRLGLVTVKEWGEPRGFVRPLENGRRGPVWNEQMPAPSNPDPGIYPPVPPGPPSIPRVPNRPSVNTLALTNTSDRPLLLLAGEIVTGGKQDRVVGKDRIVPPHSDPIALDVFCVEPHRWTGSVSFDGTAFSMAQPGIRMQAMANQDQQQVWNQVAKSRGMFASLLPAPEAASIGATSSYARTLNNTAVRAQVESMASPVENSYEDLITRLKSAKAVGAVVALNGKVFWADVFASTDLLERYWPKLVRSYAAEALTGGGSAGAAVTEQDAQSFLDHLSGGHETIDTEPGLFRSTKIQGDGFQVFILTSLLPYANYQIHMVKMRN